MAELDERTRRDLGRLRDRGAPSEAAKRRMYAAIEAQIGGDGSDGGDGGGLSGDGGVWAAKIVGATAGLTVAGLVALRVGVELVRTLTAEPKIDHPQIDAGPEQPVELASAREHDEVEVETPEATLPVETTEPPHPTDRRRDAAPRPQPAAVTDTLAAELALLEAAHAASDPANALLVLERHLAKFPHGELADERELLRVQTLCRLDRQADARALADRFLQERPGSALRQRIASACDEPKKN
jgi:hypothetical protein